MPQIKIFGSFLFTISIVEAIIGGESVLNPHEFPWVVGVRTESGKCGGTIITKNLAMTAAHCLFNSKKEFDKDISVLMGHSDISSTLIKKERVESILVHPQHGKKMYYNDVALLRLSKDLEFDNTVQPIALSNDDITGDLLLLCNKEIEFQI
jgi:secreted trypsin-like serine protease